MDINEKKEGGCDKHGICPRCKYSSNKKLNVYDWLQDIPDSNDTDFVEVQFKNTRKGYYRNSNNIPLNKGDMVAVESNPGHDIGEVTLTGRLVVLQMRKNNVNLDNPDIRRVYRKVKPVDMEKYEEAKAKEHDTMLRARKIAEDLNLNMKIGDVEYQGDGNKAIFYYIADDRVDFRQLIKVLAENFRVRIEMKQIGARQEAGRIGGIGSCGRELCCSGWMTSFVSVATSAARYQDISLNPQKLAGQCAKLKCCLNYEVDTYVEAQKQLPSREIVLVTKDGEYYHFKTDIHKRMISYSTNKEFPANLVTIPASRAFEIIALNKRGIKVDSLANNDQKEETIKEFGDIVGQDSLTRFDKSKLSKNKKRKKDGKGNQNDSSDNESVVESQNAQNSQKSVDEKDGRNDKNAKQHQNNKRSQRNQRPATQNQQSDDADSKHNNIDDQDSSNGNQRPAADRQNGNGNNQRNSGNRQNQAGSGQRQNNANQQPNDGNQKQKGGNQNQGGHNQRNSVDGQNANSKNQRNNGVSQGVNDENLQTADKKAAEKSNFPQNKEKAAADNANSENENQNINESAERRNRRFRKPPRRHFNKNRGNNDNDKPAQNNRPVQE